MNIKVAAGLAVAAVGLSACVSAPAHESYYGYEPTVVVRVAPPPPRVEYPGYPPAPGFVWIAGYWNWLGAQYVWVPGRWDAPRPGFAWVPHRWERDGERWRPHGGRWEREVPPPPPRFAPPPPPRAPFVDRDGDGRPDRSWDERRRHRERD